MKWLLAIGPLVAAFALMWLPILGLFWYFRKEKPKKYDHWQDAKDDGYFDKKD